MKKLLEAVAGEPDFDQLDCDPAASILIDLARQKYGNQFSRPDLLVLAGFDRDREETRVRKELDEITAEEGKRKRGEVFDAAAENLNITPAELKKLVKDPDHYRAVIGTSRLPGINSVPVAAEAVDYRKKREELNRDVQLDQLHLAANFGKPSRGERTRADPFGKIYVKEIEGIKKIQLELEKKRKRQSAGGKKPKKKTWKELRAPKARKAWLHFQATGRGIASEMINLTSGKEEEIFRAQQELDEWDRQRRERNLDFDGWPLPS